MTSAPEPVAALASTLDVPLDGLAERAGIPRNTVHSWRRRGLPTAVRAVARLYAGDPERVGAWLAALARDPRR